MARLEETDARAHQLAIDEATVGAERQAAQADRAAAEAALERDPVLRRVLAAGRRVLEAATRRDPSTRGWHQAFDRDTAAARDPVFDLPARPAVRSAEEARPAPRRQSGTDPSDWQ